MNRHRPQPRASLRTELAAASCVLAAASFSAHAVAQEPPPMEITLECGAEVNPPTLPFPTFMSIRCLTPALGAGVWCVPVIDLAVNPDNLQGMVGAEAMAPSTVTISGLLPLLDWSSTHLGTEVNGSPFDVAQTVSALTLNPDWRPMGAQPLFFTGNVNLPIRQYFGANLHTLQSGWVRATTQDHLYAFTMDALMQQAAWNRLQPFYATQAALFQSEAWEQVLKAFPTLSITMLGFRHHAVVPENVPLPGGDLPPGLQGYPTTVPKLTAAPQRAITFVGTGAGVFDFFPPGAAVPSLVTSVPRGSALVHTAVGYRPFMQVGIRPIGGGARAIVAVGWQSFGRVRMPIALSTVPGNYEVAEYRYQVVGGGSPQWTPWRSIPATRRLRFLVQ